MPLELSGDIAGLGKIVQIVRATDTTQRTTNSTTFVDVTGMSVTITPQKSDSTVIVIATYGADNVAANRELTVAITDGSNNPLSGAEEVLVLTVGSRSVVGQTTIGYSTPATTSATTYKLRFKCDSGDTVRILNDFQTGQMYAIEVAA